MAALDKLYNLVWVPGPSSLMLMLFGRWDTVAKANGDILVSLLFHLLHAENVRLLLVSHVMPNPNP